MVRMALRPRACVSTSNCSASMISNRPLEDWGKLLQDVHTAGATLDRFLHHAQVIAITGKSYRLKNSATRKSATVDAAESLSLIPQST